MGTRRLSAKPPKKRCPYCRALFDPPTRSRGSPIRFCCPEHRKLYHKLGALPFAKLQDQITREIDKRCLEFCLQTEHDINMAKTSSELARIVDQIRTLQFRTADAVQGLLERLAKLERDVIGIGSL